MQTLRYIFIIVLVLINSVILSQHKSFYDDEGFLKNRFEYNFGIGASSCLTDVGGSDLTEQELKKKFAGTLLRGVYDTDIAKSNIVLTGAFIYHLKPKVNLRGNLAFAFLSGSDDQSSIDYRVNRNLSFRTDILEFTAITEYYIFKPSTGNKFNLKDVSGHKLAKNALGHIGLYIMAGVGGFLYTPRAKINHSYDANNPENAAYLSNHKLINNNKYHRLRPLHTEGQGFVNNDGLSTDFDGVNRGKIFKENKTYKVVSMCIPIGFGIEKAFNNDMGIKIEFAGRYTFTDYIDDVSGSYYSKELLATNPHLGDKAELAATMSGTASGDNPLWNATGQQRGGASSNDFYGFVTFSMYKKFAGHSKWYKNANINQTRKIKASF